MQSKSDLDYAGHLKAQTEAGTDEPLCVDIDCPPAQVTRRAQAVFANARSLGRRVLSRARWRK